MARVVCLPASMRVGSSVDLALDAGGLGYDTYGVRQIAVALQLKLLAPFETTFPGATLTGNASVAGVNQAGKPLAPDGAQARS